ncbi:MAG: NTP transferase domain-containing protein [Firmicutes bacterium]|nr:NTP transferase domain-containing protein [Bacillota bacterium]
MKAVIMAGGEGTRLRPLTCGVPKPMVPILNKPMMEHILNLLRSHGIREIASTLWYLPKDVTDYFGDGSEFGVTMEYFVEEEPLGTAGSVKNAEDFLDETFIVVSGDSLTDIDLTRAVEFHRSKNAVATIVLTRVSNPLSYGIVITNEDGRIQQFLEKPSWSEVFSDTVNTGIYVLEPEVLQLFGRGENFDFSRDLFPKLLKQKAPLYGYVADGYWSDVGNLDVYRQVQQDCLDGKVRIVLPEPRAEGLFIEEGAVIDPDVVVAGPVYIGRGARVEAGVELGQYTVIGPNCLVSAGASIKRSTLWAGAQVGSGSELRGCVLGQNARVQQRVKIFEGAVVGDNTAVGSHSTIMPGAKVWPWKRIASGSTLKQSIVWGHQERPSLFSKTGITGDLQGQLPLEDIVRVGLSYGEFLGSGKRVLVTCDGSANARVAKRALIAGLLNGGLNVLDAGTAVGNITRFGTRLFRTQGALHCESLSDTSGLVNIQCWNEQGYLLSKSEQRKLENIFLRDDYPRHADGELGELSFVPGLSDRYLDALAKTYQAARGTLKVGVRALSDRTRALGELIADFLERAGYQLAEGNHEGQITVVVDDDGWYFEDERGQRVDEDTWWGIFAQVLKKRARHAIPMPVRVSEHISKLAHDAGLKVHWTRLEPQFWMEAATELGITTGDDEVEFFPYIEPLASIGEVLHYISSQDSRLADLVSVPETSSSTKQILCPWSEKGRVMRQLIGQTNPENTLYLDGIKEYTDTGWALVVPDGDEPVFRIYSEAQSPEEAEALADYYAKLIMTHIDEE